MTISIHQPNLLPRISYFEKIAQSDLFVIISHAKFTKGGFQNRFNIDDKFYGMAVNKGTQLIVDKKYTNIKRDWSKITTALPKLSVLNDYIISENLSQTNTAIIRAACLMLGIHTPITCDMPRELTGTERLIDICQKHDATKYLSGVSGKNYLDLSLFDAAGIEVIFQDETKMDKRALVEVL